MLAALLAFAPPVFSQDATVFEIVQTELAAFFLSLGVIKDPTGNSISPSQQVALAKTMAAKHAKHLILDAEKNKIRLAELVKTFKKTAGVGLKAGLTLDESREFSVLIAQAAPMIGVPAHEIGDEVRAVLLGPIDRSARIASFLGITDQGIKSAREEGKLMNFLRVKFAPVTSNSSDQK